MRKNKQFYTKILDNFDKVSDEEKKRVFKRLSELYNTQMLVSENLEEGVIALTRDTEIRFLNSKASFLLGIPNTCEGKKLREYIENNSFVKSILEFVESDETIYNEIIHDKKNMRILRVNVLPLGFEGKLEGTLILVFDITQIWANEQKLKRAEQLASLTTVAAGIAHEIKNPLGSISIYIQLIEKMISRMKGESEEKKEIKEYCQIVKEEISRLEDTVNSFLFSVRTINLELEEQSICDIITATLNFLKYEIEKNNIEINVHFDKEKIILMLDMKYIKQAFINIIQNSIDALTQKEKKTITIDVTENKDFVEIVIKDNGEGISEKNIKKILEPYFTTKSKGTGLGLTNVVRIIEAHGGTLDIASEEKIGTNVTIKLPSISLDKRLIVGE